MSRRLRTDRSRLAVRRLACRGPSSSGFVRSPPRVMFGQWCPPIVGHRIACRGRGCRWRPWLPLRYLRAPPRPPQARVRAAVRSSRQRPPMRCRPFCGGVQPTRKSATQPARLADAMLPAAVRSSRFTVETMSLRLTAEEGPVRSFGGPFAASRPRGRCVPASGAPLGVGPVLPVRSQAEHIGQGSHHDVRLIRDEPGPMRK